MLHILNLSAAVRVAQQIITHPPASSAGQAVFTPSARCESTPLKRGITAFIPLLRGEGVRQLPDGRG